MATADSVSRLNIRIAPEIKRSIEAAAAHLGQTVSDFATSTLAQASRQVILDQNVTQLSDRDRKRFLAMLANTDSKPKAALVAAARRHRSRGR